MMLAPISLFVAFLALMAKWLLTLSIVTAEITIEKLYNRLFFESVKHKYVNKPRIHKKINATSPPFEILSVIVVNIPLQQKLPEPL